MVTWNSVRIDYALYGGGGYIFYAVVIRSHASKLLIVQS